MTEIPTLSPRLAAAASLIRQGAMISDVGTDHAYLPIYLCLTGRAVGGVVSDINAGPIERARDNIKKYGLDGRLAAVRTDGLRGIEPYRPTDIMILGMGGELIARIIGDAPFTRDSGIRLCLQPMTHPELLRAFLADNGYAIIDEVLAEEDRIYQVILAEYTGKPYSLSQVELLLGHIDLRRGGEALKRSAQRYAAAFERQAKGIESAGKDATAQRDMIAQLKAIIENTDKGEDI